MSAKIHIYLDKDHWIIGTGIFGPTIFFINSCIFAKNEEQID